jgi:AraC-like DNA-binding protein
MMPSAPDALRAHDRDGDVRSLHRRGVTWVPLQPIPGLPCGADITTRNLSGLGLQSGSVWGNRHEHTARDLVDSNDDVSLHINLAGTSVVTWDRREITLRDGDAVLLAYSRPRTITRLDTVHHRIIRLPRASLAPQVRNIDDAVLRLIPRGTGALSLLSNYVGISIEDPAIERPDIRQTIVAHFCDLIAVTLDAMRDPGPINGSHGIRAARLQAIKHDIEAHLSDERLSAVSVARRQGVSDSYIRKLLHDEGISFSAFVLDRRLARAHRIITDRRWTDRSIASIALQTGFGDISYFNRTFKRRYGASPSEIRKESNF